MSGHDQFPEAQVWLTPAQAVQVYPGVHVDIDQSVAVVEWSGTPVESPANLLVIVVQAYDHHGEDVRELVAERIAKGLSQ